MGEEVSQVLGTEALEKQMLPQCHKLETFDHTMSLRSSKTKSS